MGSRIGLAIAPILLDPACVPDTFCEGVGYIGKTVGDCFRFTIFATRDAPDGGVERIVVAQLVWPIAALRIANRQSKMAIDGLQFLSDVVPLKVPI